MASAQLQPAIQPPPVIQGSLIAERPESFEDPGVAVRLFESTTLDRFVRKAHEFLARDDYSSAIKVLQDVLEGNVRPQEDGDATTAVAAGDDIDAAHAVFTSDERLYRPVRRLCQELLASMPEPGRRMYRQMFEVAAQNAYAAALERRDITALEATYNRYFATHAAARALDAAGDLLMHAGRLRAAAQTFRTLLEAYPIEFRDQVEGVSAVYAEFKIALCLGEIGDRAAAIDLMRQLAQRHPNATLRLCGELIPIDALADRALADNDATTPIDAPPLSAGVEAPDVLVPVWQYRYAEPQPYKQAAAVNERILVQGGAAPAAPRFNQFKPGTTVLPTDDGMLAFLDHFRLRVADAGNGLLRQETNDPLLPPPPRQGQTRARVPVLDWSTLRVVADEARFYTVIGSRPTSNPLAPLLDNELVARDRHSLQPVWSSKEWDTDNTANHITFVAAPTVWGKRLLVPVLSNDAYGLLGVDAATGARAFLVLVHSGGTELTRTPTAPVVVDQGTAYLLTNAGALAAIDPHVGELRWIRRYERTDPLHPTPNRTRAGGETMLGAVFREVDLRSFAPSEVVAVDGRVVIAPVDGDAVLCLDGASGNLVWVAGREQSDAENYIVGSNSRFLYLCSRSHFVCIEHRTGRRLWQMDSPNRQWSGRGVVGEHTILVPGERCVYSLDAAGGAWQRIPLPAFSVGDEPLQGPCNLLTSGPYLVSCFEAGFEVHASLHGLQRAAAASGTPLERADCLVQAGDLSAAIDCLGPLAIDPTLSEAERGQIARRTLALVRDVVLSLAASGHGEPALAMLDRCRPWLPTRDLLLRWQLLRIDSFRALHDNDAVAREQDTLYAMMEGRL